VGLGNATIRDDLPNRERQPFEDRQSQRKPARLQEEVALSQGRVEELVAGRVGVQVHAATPGRDVFCILSDFSELVMSSCREKMSEVPNRLANYMTHKQYLHATKLLVEAVSLGKNTLEGVESLKELSRELEQKKEQLHIQLFNELKEHLFTRPAQRIVALRRQESGRDNFMINSPLQRSTELRLSRNRMAVRRNIMESAQKYQIEINRSF
jgi:hypothetical protein